MIERIINKLSNHPQIFHFLRKIIENNFQAQQRVISQYFSLKSSEKILDIGCGTGEFSVFFSPDNYTGIDIKERYLDFARKNYPGKFLVADATNLPFADNSFSKVLIIGVLHHLSNVECLQVLKEAKRVLSRHGKILIMEDIQTSQDNYLTKLVHYFDKGKQIRTKATYDQLLKDYFKIIKNFRIKSGLCPYQVFLLENKR